MSQARRRCKWNAVRQCKFSFLCSMAMNSKKEKENRTKLTGAARLHIFCMFIICSNRIAELAEKSNLLPRYKPRYISSAKYNFLDDVAISSICVISLANIISFSLRFSNSLHATFVSPLQYPVFCVPVTGTFRFLHSPLPAAREVLSILLYAVCLYPFQIHQSPSSLSLSLLFVALHPRINKIQNALRKNKN